MHLLAALAIGYDEARLPGGVDITGWRAEIERTRSMDPAQARREIDAVRSVPVPAQGRAFVTVR
ncbi:hypothetical protein [Microtetraspora glauca]|uniref:Uncharacterized protein n=1 Tax=Microtetraspora glauca TaxID=1996 RepID=A0ABV3GM18_MICGL